MITVTYIAFSFARAKRIKRHDLQKVLPKVTDEPNFKPHASGLHRPTAHVVNISRLFGTVSC